MKKVILMLVLLLAAISAGANEPFARDSVIPAGDLSSQQIYESLKKWFITNAKYDSRYIIEHDDAQNKHLVGRMNFNYICKHVNWAAGSGHISVVIEIMARDGRFKIRLSDFRHVSENPKFPEHWSLGAITEEIPEEWASGWKTKQQRETYKRVLPRCKEIAELLIGDIAEYARDFKPIEGDDW